MSHAGCLRDEGEPEDEVVALVRALTLAGEQGLEAVGPALDGRGLSSRDRALLGFVARLALRPRAMGRGDLSELLAAGFTGREAHDVVHVVCCFSYMNRLADGLGVTVDEPDWEWAARIYGEVALTEHLAWGAAP